MQLRETLIKQSYICNPVTEVIFESPVMSLTAAVGTVRLPGTCTKVKSMHVDEGILWSPTACKTDHQPSSCYVQLTRVVVLCPLPFPLQLQQHTHSHMRPLQPQGANKRAVRLEGYPSAPQGWRYRWCACQEHVARPSIRLVALCTARMMRAS